MSELAVIDAAAGRVREGPSVVADMVLVLAARVLVAGILGGVSDAPPPEPPSSDHRDG